MGVMGQILACVTWVHKILVWVKKNGVGRNFGVGGVVHKILVWWHGSIKFLNESKSWRELKTLSIFFTKGSLHVFVPGIRLFAFLMLISYSNWRGPKVIYRP